MFLLFLLILTRIRGGAFVSGLHTKHLAILQILDVDARSREVLLTIHKPLDDGNYEDYEEDNDTVVCSWSVKLTTR
jgi:hypothetical protein